MPKVRRKLVPRAVIEHLSLEASPVRIEPIAVDPETQAQMDAITDAWKPRLEDIKANRVDVQDQSG